MSDKAGYHRETKLMHVGRKPDDYFGVVNPPICRASTILYKDLAAYSDPDTKFRYGRMGNPLSQSFEGAMAELEGGFNAVSTPSGLSAITTALWSFLKAGDHFLMVDSCYPPARFFVTKQLRAFGVDVEFYDPMIGADIQSLIRENTAVIYMETPGSASFDVQDVPAITAVAKARGIITIVDNTYSSGILFSPLAHGANIVLQSCAKYIGGHSDINLGVVIADNEAHYKTLKSCALNLGVCGAAEDMYLALRGLRTLEMRLKQASKGMQPVLAWFQNRPEIAGIYSPMLADHPGHDIWKRDFSGVNGLFSVLLKPEYTMESIARFVDSLELFPVGSSWGGYESLIQPQDMKAYRADWKEEGFFLRFQIGNENTQDLIADLEQGILNLKL